jgi:hypothetical protein
VALYKALGGGWNEEVLPATPAPTPQAALKAEEKPPAQPAPSGAAGAGS